MNNIKIIDKMIRELRLAKENEQSNDVMLKHIGNVQLFCDLFLEDLPVEPTTTSFSDQEIKMMLGEEYTEKVNEKQQTKLEHDDANGDSIFDF